MCVFLSGANYTPVYNFTAIPEKKQDIPINYPANGADDSIAIIRICKYFRVFSLFIHGRFLPAETPRVLQKNFEFFSFCACNYRESMLL